MPWAKNVRCQQDGAAAHTGKDNLNKLNIAGRGRKRKNCSTKSTNITVFTQPAQSSDTNTHDLVKFPAISKRFNKKQKFEKINDLEQLVANAVQTWNEFPTDVLYL